MITILTLGDWSDDGHGKTADYQIKHNLPSTQALNDAHKKGAAILGIDFEETAAVDYEEPYLPEEVFEALLDYGTIEPVPEEDKTSEYHKGKPFWRLAKPSPVRYCDWISDDSGDYAIDQDTYLALWMAIAQIGEPTLEYSVENADRTNTLTIGGYGLFYS